MEEAHLTTLTPEILSSALHVLTFEKGLQQLVWREGGMGLPFFIPLVGLKEPWISWLIQADNDVEETLCWMRAH